GGGAYPKRARRRSGRSAAPEGRGGRGGGPGSRGRGPGVGRGVAAWDRPPGTDRKERGGGARAAQVGRGDPPRRGGPPSPRRTPDRPLAPAPGDPRCACGSPRPPRGGRGGPVSREA